MNKYLLMILLTSGGGVGGFVRGPYIPLAMYYFYAVLRPQYLWKWELMMYPDPPFGGWSFYMAGAALITYLPWVFGIVGPINDPERRVFPGFIWAHRLMLMFFTWVTVSYLNAMNQDVAWVSYQEMIKIALMYMLATQVVRAFWQVWGLYMIFTLAIGYIAVDINHLYVTTGYLLLVRAGFAGLDNNGAALLLSLGVPMAYFAWELTRGWHRWLLLPIIPAIIHAVVSSYSRGAMLSVIITLPLYFLYTRKRKSLAVMLLVGLAMLPFMAGQEIRNRFMTVEHAEEDETLNLRFMSWRAAYLIATDYPVFGIGPRNSNLVSKHYGTDMEGRTIHNNYLQIAADNGWVGMGLFVLLLIFVVLSMWRARRRLWKHKDPESVRAVAMLGGLECTLWTFIIGSWLLSLETFEPAYIVMLLGAQIWAISNAQVTPAPGYRAGQAQWANVGPRPGGAPPPPPRPRPERTEETWVPPSRLDDTPRP
ncbi:O-antigen ligase family protein [Fimbriiglobus ruber]|uniref:O-antigen ligase-related domain-containing protein n=1 Tax=Fimbriiglobus ruber TaxID=1908690 RepID=A0A225DR30_9BACT|nr:O-antigen ligase family protein [Fimbriiglobus ruber]OWK43553.1 hypothetical protein FRUB_03152 [Fimbriiglobus ruber]